MAKLTRRTNKNNKDSKIKATDIVVGDVITIGEYTIEVVQIDELEKRLCFVDKYACDYYVGKNEYVVKV